MLNWEQGDLTEMLIQSKGDVSLGAKHSQDGHHRLQDREVPYAEIAPSGAPALMGKQDVFSTQASPRRHRTQR